LLTLRRDCAIIDVRAGSPTGKGAGNVEAITQDIRTAQEHLTNAIRARGIRLEELADAVGLSRQRIAAVLDMESESLPKPQTLNAIAEQLGMSVRVRVEKEQPTG
jgi:lambda repressor-like predicted transcriptional regulator